MIALAPKLRLPLEAVTQTFAILGKRGSGKTTTATVLTEELLAAGQQVIVIDPLDVTWGLRSSRNGKAAGFAITVLGGDHADLPLEASAGVVLADFAVAHRASLILSLRHFSLADQRRFVTDFCERLYALKGQQANRTALHLVIDEVDEFAHQRIPAGFERLFGAIDRLVRRGRSSGIGVTMISQRPAVIHKDILSQAEVLICHQTISPQDRKALDAWVEAHDAHDQRDAFLSTIATLQRGEAWVWSPGWLDLFARVTIRDRQTFDSSATPKAGERPPAPKTVAPVDLEQLRAQMTATIEKAKADDPKALRQRIAALEREVAAKPAPTRVEVPVLTGNQLTQISVVVSHVEAALKQMTEALAAPVAALRGHLQQLTQAVASVRQPALPLAPSPRPSPAPRAEPSRRPPAAAPRGGPEALPPGERAVLTAAAQYPQGVSREQVSILTGYKRSSRDTYIQRLVSRACVEVVGGQVVVTEAGLAALGDDFTPLPTGDALRQYWLERLPPGEKAVLYAVCRAYPHSVTREALGEMTGYKRSSRDTYIHRLQARRLIVTDRGGVVASAVLFDGGLA